jgi:hypothetical protein
MYLEREVGEPDTAYQKRLLSELHAAKFSESGKAILDVIENEALLAYGTLLRSENAENAWANLLAFKAIQSIHYRITSNVDEALEAIEKSRIETLASDKRRQEQQALHTKRLRASGASYY